MVVGCVFGYTAMVAISTLSTGATELLPFPGAMRVHHRMYEVSVVFNQASFTGTAWPLHPVVNRGLWSHMARPFAQARHYCLQYKRHRDQPVADLQHMLHACNLIRNITIKMT